MSGNANGVNLALLEIKKEIERMLLEHNRSIKNNGECKPFFVLVLDDFHTILPMAHHHHTNASEIIGKLIGMIDSLQQDGYAAGIIAIMNNSLANVDLEDRIRSRTEAAVINFPPYTRDELLRILLDRNSRALCKPAPFEVIDECVKKCCYEHGDARRAITLFRATLDTAFASGIISPSGITRNHVIAAGNMLMFSGNEPAAERTMELPFQKKFVLGVLAALVLITGKHSHSSVEIYDQYQRYMTTVIQTVAPSGMRVIGEQAVRRYLSELEEQGLISSTMTSRGRGKGMDNKIYTLKAPANTIGAMAFGSFWYELVSAKDDIAQLELIKTMVDANFAGTWYGPVCNFMLTERINWLRNKISYGQAS